MQGPGWDGPRREGILRIFFSPTPQAPHGQDDPRRMEKGGVSSANLKFQDWSSPQTRILTLFPCLGNRGTPEIGYGTDNRQRGVVNRTARQQTEQKRFRFCSGQSKLAGMYNRTESDRPSGGGH